MTKRFQLIAVMVLFASGAAAQQAPSPKPPDQTPQQPAEAGDMAITVLVDEPARAIVAQAGPLVINATFDAAVPPIAGAVRNGNVVTITTTAAHGLTGCTSVTIAGVTDPSFNGTFTITGVTQTTFTYAQTAANATSNGGQVLLNGSTTPAERAVIQQAINEWQAIVQDSGSTANPYPLSVRFTALGVTPTCPGNILGLTNPFVNTTTGNILFANMAFNTGFTFYEGLADPPAGSATDLLSVTRHELGHALGWAGSVRLNNLTNLLTAAIAAGNGAVRNANVVTITTTAAHGFSVGQGVTIGGVADVSFNGDRIITTVPSATIFTYAQTGPNAISGGGSASAGAVAAPRLNIPVVFASGLHTDPGWRPNDLMVPTIGQATRRPISLYPAASLVARAYEYTVPMQYVDPTFAGEETGTAVQPWQTVLRACAFSPLGTPLILSNATHIVPAFFRCANRHVVNAARGGAFVRP